jgi:arylformamidase
MAHWPGDPDVEISLYESIADGCEYNATRISMSAHTGTHIDAPLHYFASGNSIDQMPLEAMTGSARVIASADILTANIGPGDRILAKTGGNSLTKTQAQYLANRGARLAGIDSLSIGGLGQDCGDVHRILLSAGVWIVEGLMLDGIEPGSYDLLCLPLKLMGADGAPARALLRRT